MHGQLFVANGSPCYICRKYQIISGGENPSAAHVVLYRCH